MSRDVIVELSSGIVLSLCIGDISAIFKEVDRLYKLYHGLLRLITLYGGHQYIVDFVEIALLEHLEIIIRYMYTYS